MSENVTYLPVPDGMDMDPDRILEAAVGELSSVVILGTHKDGSEYFAWSLGDGGEVLWLLERLKWHMMRAVEDDR